MRPGSSPHSGSRQGAPPRGHLGDRALLTCPHDTWRLITRPGAAGSAQCWPVEVCILRPYLHTCTSGGARACTSLPLHCEADASNAQTNDIPTTALIVRTSLVPTVHRKDPCAAARYRKATSLTLLTGVPRVRARPWFEAGSAIRWSSRLYYDAHIARGYLPTRPDP